MMAVNVNHPIATEQLTNVSSFIVPKLETFVLVIHIVLLEQPVWDNNIQKSTCKKMTGV